jgi:hypothetical protein
VERERAVAIELYITMVVTRYYGGDEIPIFLLAVYGKGEKGDLTRAERNELARTLSQIADTYRKLKI